MKINYKQYHMTVVCASLVASLSILDLAGQDGGEIPESIKKEMQFLVGDWNFSATRNGEPVTGNYSARWASGGTCLLMTFRSDSDDSTGVSSWDAATNEIVENWFDPGTGRIELRYKVTSPAELKGTSKRVAMNGEKSEGKLSLTKNGPDSFRYTEETGGFTWEIDNNRVQRSMASKQPLMDELAALVGVWEEKDDKGVRRWVFDWSPEKNFLNNQQTAFGPDGKPIWTLNGSLGWDQGRNQITNWCVWGGGGESKFFWKKLTQNTWEASNESGNMTWKFTPESSRLRVVNNTGLETVFLKR